MQTQPFVLGHLNTQRQSDLHAASLDVRSTRYSAHATPRLRFVERLRTLLSRRPAFQAPTGSAGAGVQPIAGR